jgi:hypothetical protein
MIENAVINNTEVYILTNNTGCGSEIFTNIILTISGHFKDKILCGYENESNGNKRVRLEKEGFIKEVHQESQIVQTMNGTVNVNGINDNNQSNNFGRFLRKIMKAFRKKKINLNDPNLNSKFGRRLYNLLLKK